MIPTDSTIWSRLGALQTATVGDVLDEMGLDAQILHSTIRPVGSGMKLAGPAFTISGRAGASAPSTHGEPSVGYEMFRHMTAGCIAVLDTGAYTTAGPWGENTALSARMRGCAGVVIAGGTRDSVELAAMGFPTFAEFVTPARVERRWHHIAFGQTIELPGQVKSPVVINPGDGILADADGVVVVPTDILPEVIPAAEEVARIEEEMRRLLALGIDREEVYRTHARFAHISPTKR
jgi:regulator of RNase E activity RraA